MNKFFIKERNYFMKKLFLLALTTILLNPVNALAKEYSVEKTFEEIGDCKKSECLSIDIQKMVFNKSINYYYKINEYLDKELFVFLDPDKKTTGIKSAIKEIKTNYKNDFENSSKDKIAYSSNYRFLSKIIYKSKNYLTLQIDEDSFAGGAHGNYFSIYSTFDSNTGKVLTLKDLDKNLSKITRIGESKFRELKKIPYNKKLNDFDFFFNKDKFYLPENFGITDKSVIFYYNSYEIASYAAGPTELVMDKSFFSGLKKK